MIQDGRSPVTVRIKEIQRVIDLFVGKVDLGAIGDDQRELHLPGRGDCYLSREDAGRALDRASGRAGESQAGSLERQGFLYGGRFCAADGSRTEGSGIRVVSWRLVHVRGSSVVPPGLKSSLHFSQR